MAKESSWGIEDFERYKRLMVLEYRLRCQAVKALKRGKWRLEVWSVYHTEIEPAAQQIADRARQLVSLFGDPPEKLPERFREHYLDAIHELADIGYTDGELQRIFSRVEKTGNGGRRDRVISFRVQKLLSTIHAIRRAAEMDAGDLARWMPKLEANAKKTSAGRNKKNRESAQDAAYRQSYYNLLAVPYWRNNWRLSRTEVAKRIVEDHSEQIKQDLKLENCPSVNTIRQSLEKPAE